MDNQGEKIDLSDYTSSDSNEEVQQKVPSNSYFGSSKLTKWMIKVSGGLIQNDKQASYVLLSLVLLMIIITTFLVFSLVKKTPRQKEYNPNTKYQGKELPDSFR